MPGSYDAVVAPPWPTTPPTAADHAVFADAQRRAFWLDDVEARAVTAPLEGGAEADLCIVGGGFTGLWAALHAKREDPARDVVLLEAESAGFGASGRNGGFVVSSLTHGIANGMARFAPEMPALERLGRENLDGLAADVARLGIDCELERTGELTVALEPHQRAWLEEEAALLERFGHAVQRFPDADAIRAEVASPTYLAGLWDRDGGGLLHPGRLATGLRDAALAAGVRVHEGTRATGLRRAGAGMVVEGERGASVRARRVLLAAGAFPPLLRALRRHLLPVYDYVLVTEPLALEQRAALGWARRQGLADPGNRFHYYRLTGDDRILFGGYDAVYRYGGPVHDGLDDHAPTFARLAQHLRATFPQLEGVRATHAWGGAIDTCSRFSVFFGTAHGGRVAYAAGYTGLGVAATRFGAQVALDLLDGRETEATRLRYVRTRPVPFPPEPLRSAVVQLTRNRLAAADRHAGRRGVWLRTLDRLGLGFDS
ncbi:MAG: FAD-dependent oxidoreductase [Solirubrobacterales bacterium]|nr:FAD-dependent oxidoreductase [Solirubrobacterales bacterium]